MWRLWRIDWFLIMENHYEKLLDEAMSEHGVFCFRSIDQPLVTDLCEVVGALYRELERIGYDDAKIKQQLEGLPIR